jgi:hypothetical protein
LDKGKQDFSFKQKNMQEKSLIKKNILQFLENKDIGKYFDFFCKKVVK